MFDLPADLRSCDVLLDMQTPQIDGEPLACDTDERDGEPVQGQKMHSHRTPQGKSI